MRLVKKKKSFISALTNPNEIQVFYVSFYRRLAVCHNKTGM